jgi:NTP pyrophosphatase (non-canonical NTP hydrolase)
LKNNLLKIIRHYGLKNQLRKLNEEVFELIEAIRDTRFFFSKTHIEEEFADVMVLLSQIKHYYNLDSNKLKKIMDYKINRQLERMKKGE